MTNYEKFEYLFKLIDGAKNLNIKTEVKVSIDYRGRKGHIMFNTNGVMDFVVGEEVSHVYEISNWSESRIMMYGYDKWLDRVSSIDVWFNEFEIDDNPKIKTYDS
jgi:hypothetical protein